MKYKVGDIIAFSSKKKKDAAVISYVIDGDIVEYVLSNGDVLIEDHIIKLEK